MELLLDLALTLSLSFIVTFLFVKVASIHPMNTDKIESTTDTDNAVKIDQFKSISQQEKMIKLEKCHCKAEGKISSVKSRNGEVISGKKIQNIVIVDDRELEEDEIEELSVIHQGEVIKLERCHFEAEDKSTSVRSRNVDSVSGNKFQNIVVVDDRERGDEIEELSMIDQFQWIPHQGEVIKLEKFHCEAQVLEGFWSVFGEYELANYGFSKEQMLIALSAGCFASLFVGSFLGILSDALGHKKFCLLFSILHFIISVWKMIAAHPIIWVANICLSLASSIYSFSFETWMVVEHEKQGYRQDALNDTFWLMNFFESVSVIGSQILANWVVAHGSKKSFLSPSLIMVLLTMVNIAITARGLTESSAREKLKEHRTGFFALIFGDKRIWLLICAQACLHFSFAVFWILWAPTIVADGRGVQLGFIYPCLLGARMLGSTAFPWSLSGLLSLRLEDCLFYEFIIAGLVLSIVAYDYQEIGVLVVLFCLFQALGGLIFPTLARMRTMYVPNEYRAGMMSLSLAPTNAAILCVLNQGGYYRNLNNSTVTAFAALGLFLAAGCMHMLKNLGKQPHQNWHKQ